LYLTGLLGQVGYLHKEPLQVIAAAGFLQTGWSVCHPTNSVKAPKGTQTLASTKEHHPLSSSFLNVTYNTHTIQPFYGSLDFVWDNPGEPVPE